MACHVVAMDKRPVVRTVGIGEKICRAIAKFVMRAVVDQAKKACGSLQICAGLEDGIERATHALLKRRQDITTLAPRNRETEESDYDMLW